MTHHFLKQNETDTGCFSPETFFKEHLLT